MRQSLKSNTACLSLSVDGFSEETKRISRSLERMFVLRSGKRGAYETALRCSFCLAFRAIVKFYSFFFLTRLPRLSTMLWGDFKPKKYPFLFLNSQRKLAQ